MLISSFSRLQRHMHFTLYIFFYFLFFTKSARHYLAWHAEKQSIYIYTCFVDCAVSSWSDVHIIHSYSHCVNICLSRVTAIYFNGKAHINITSVTVNFQILIKSFTRERMCRAKKSAGCRGATCIVAKECVICERRSEYMFQTTTQRYTLGTIFDILAFFFTHRTRGMSRYILLTR